MVRAVGAQDRVENAEVGLEPPCAAVAERGRDRVDALDPCPQDRAGMAPAESPLSHFSIKSAERVRILTAGFGILNPGRRPEYRNTTPGVISNTARSRATTATSS